jgi:DNA-binding response OmpR family regulator
MSLKIFLIEDDTDDIELLQDALNRHSITYDMHSVKDGGEALEYIRIVSEAPDIIILDMNLPKVHGRDIIPVIKSSDHFKHVPLLILTTSSSTDDIDYAYKNGANKYLQKPATVEGIRETIEIIVELAGKE